MKFRIYLELDVSREWEPIIEYTPIYGHPRRDDDEIATSRAYAIAEGLIILS